MSEWSIWASGLALSALIAGSCTNTGSKVKGKVKGSLVTCAHLYLDIPHSGLIQWNAEGNKTPLQECTYFIIHKGHSYVEI